MKVETKNDDTFNIFSIRKEEEQIKDTRKKKLKRIKKKCRNGGLT